ncbi:hypothetical protein [Nonomuraea ceibae]|uniref:hypothetical protein n=1 Tax=Nonomuraea ceibae TaxID=1935170 RepID=UPI001C5DD5B6|nr:hypothetical protein [Nonomuraea ceibae]
MPPRPAAGRPRRPAYADLAEGLVGILLTQAAMDSATTPRLHRDFWTTAYQM